MSKRIIVLGAGITGLVTAWKMAKEGYDVTLIEKEKNIGGLAGTIDWDGFKFDFGAHNFFSKDLDVVGFYENKLPNIFRERKLKVKLQIYGKLINYPLLGAQVFLTLSPLKMILAGFSFLWARFKALCFGITKTKHLDEWIIRRFGKILYKTYFGPYLERVQKKAPHLLSSDIGDKKIPIFSIRQYIKREIFRNSDFHPDDINTFKTYYCVKGYGEFSNFFLGELQNMKNVTLLLNESLKSITINNDIITSITTDNRLIDTQETDIISTIPLEHLITSINSIDTLLKNTVQTLEYTRMRFFLIKVRQPFVTGLSWVNFNDQKFPYYRVSESIYDEFKMAPKGLSSLCFEIPLNVDDYLWSISDKELLQVILVSFNTVFALKEEDIIETKSVFIDHANPRMALGYHESLEMIFKFIDRTKNLFSIGRQGLFTYVNLDGCTKMAFQFSDGFIKSQGKDLNRSLINKFHSIVIN